MVDNQIVVQFIDKLPAILTGIAAVLAIFWNGRKTDSVGKKTDAIHSAINSRLDEWKAETRAAAIAAATAAYKEGVTAGANAHTDRAKPGGIQRGS